MGDPDRGPTASDEEIVAVFANADDRWLRTTDAADDPPVAIEVLFDRLEDLYEQGLLVVDEDDTAPGERWRLAPGASDEIPVPQDEVETDVEAQATTVTGSEASPHEGETPETPPPDPGTDPVGPIRDSPTDASDGDDRGAAVDTGAAREESDEAEGGDAAGGRRRPCAAKRCFPARA